LKDELVFDNTLIYIVNPPESKPLKITWECLPCPRYPDYRCEHSKFKSEEFAVSIYCELKKCIRK